MYISILCIYRLYYIWINTTNQLFAISSIRSTAILCTVKRSFPIICTGDIDSEAERARKLNDIFHTSKCLIVIFNIETTSSVNLTIAMIK